MRIILPIFEVVNDSWSYTKYLQVKNTAEFWEFAEGQMLDGLYWEYWYNTGSDK